MVFLGHEMQAPTRHTDEKSGATDSRQGSYTIELSCWQRGRKGEEINTL